ncbi:serine protease [Arsukibacterium ikkense]|uniref:Serine protease n=1 Tax=Arsukibacterium ikkense TaxID=336831 RepID=A0A0M2V625_9GAMM|nr:nodulation protein NfeD [Arsukibacterium ikkense]KKO46292.1 serine protease [Arsukibacterium ikkense]
MLRLALIMLFIMLMPAPASASSVVNVLRVEGAIGPGISDYLTRAIDSSNAQQPQPSLILITLDTPGGLAASVRDINQAILASPIPVACLVYPQGARAASAGTYLLYACHIAAMASATSLGAATPVPIAGPAQAPSDADKPQGPAAMEKKVLNDSVAYIRSLAQLRHRNAEWAEQAVREAATLTASEALAQQVIDFIADTPHALVARLDGYVLPFAPGQGPLVLENAQLVDQSPDWRTRFITTITDPNVAYILMLLGIYGLLLEFYSPGIGVAGVVGAICLLLALFAFQLLPVNYAGFGLLLLGIGLLLAESLLPSFGILGFGGLVAFVLGSIFLLDSDLEAFQIAWPVLLSVTLFSSAFLVLMLGYIWRKRKMATVSGIEAIIGAQAEVLDGFPGTGRVLLQGECWQARCAMPLQPGQTARVTALDGLVLQLASEKEQTDE